MQFTTPSRFHSPTTILDIQEGIPLTDEHDRIDEEYRDAMEAAQVNAYEEREANRFAFDPDCE